ncbi:MAG TPA: chloride channel protein [Bacteroidales bacterium]|mgnify:FL=1|jgi:CIC family chloride channel protein|nr:Voltage-gated ClC-type chloride channel ClcB [Bacteroidales bacterium]MCZ2418142.1 chloride channel protein [Burkholderiales bacterium]OQC56604.1 MAG: H(+)/Cl(-) exchange transporter ClcA [Bacteroidetes bacterium ADurb.Bin013]MCZ2317353.1 chloride channel protein [Bacteroidales bacterium]HNR27886.1 chloride channel protein [Bacteroidales bacterium]
MPKKIWTKIKSLPEPTLLLLLSLVIGLLSGLAAVILKSSIAFIKDLLTTHVSVQAESLAYFLLPGTGMLLSLLFVRYFVKDNISHGVTRVLESISVSKSRIKPHNCYTSIISSALTIGFGGSVGAEAPIVYTGAAIGSNVGRSLGLNYRSVTLLVCCGTAAAIAGIFKAPLAGVLFCFEILLFNLTIGSLIPLLTASITATVVSSLIMGDGVSFASSTAPFQITNIPYYLILGIVCGFTSIFFTRTTLMLESRIKRIHNIYTRWAFSALILGVLILLFPPLYGEGYGSLSALLNNNVEGAVDSLIYGPLSRNPWFIPIFFTAVLLLKVFAMSFTNAGGGVGGTFGPTLFMGGILGFVISRALNLAGVSGLPESNFALVGMAGLMAGVMKAPMTAIFLIAEITGGYQLLVPLIITAVCSFVTARGFEPYSIYTKRIAREGKLLTHDSDQAVLTLLKTSDLIENDFMTVNPHDSLEHLVHVVEQSSRNLFPVTDLEGCLQGVVSLDDIRPIMFRRELYGNVFVYELMHRPVEYVFIDERMESVMEKFERTDAWNLPVLDEKFRYMGFVSKSRILSAYREQLSQVSHE